MVTVVGCGNRMCSDDAVGLEAVQLLQAMGVPEGVRVMLVGTPGIGLLDLFTPRGKVILVDAVVSGAKPGTIHRFTMDNLPPRNFIPLSMHGINAVDALTLGRLVTPDAMPSQVVILGMEIRDRRPYREGLSDTILDHLPQLVGAIQDELVMALS